MQQLLLNILLLLTLAFTISVEACCTHMGGHFGVQFRQSIDKNCTKVNESQEKMVRDKNRGQLKPCVNFEDGFRTFSYYWLPYRTVYSNPFLFGRCSLRIFAAKDCQDEVLHIPDGNNWSHMMKCHTMEHDLGRSVIVGPCVKFDWAKGPYIKGEKPKDIPAE